MDLERRHLRVRGVVQGVGFRPHVHGLAARLAVAGRVGNDDAGVFIEIEGTAAALDEFLDLLVAESPPLARIEAVEVTPAEPTGRPDFMIVESQETAGLRTAIPPDVATCDDCLGELDDPSDRRYRYPFVNCTNCGPRFTIIRDLPYDRPATTMARFAMCAACAAEYGDPTDRRYHAQPVACPDCGPQLVFDSPGARHSGTDAVIAAVHRTLAAGGVVAVKGLGGYHLACDATDVAAVQTLRRRKGRIAKPFAVMAANLAAARRIASFDAAEAEAMTSPARPIVLVRRLDGALADGVAPDNPLVGVMLPYTPLHHLLVRPVPGGTVSPPQWLVMTSGNRSDEPICFDDGDARERLADLADAFCTHDRPIELPCDDSVVRTIGGGIQPVRRSRGYAPIPVRLPFDAPPVVGVGGELKNTCCVAQGRHAWVGQHVGDMENLETLAAFDASVEAFTKMYRVDPVAYGVDRHPRYLTRRWAMERRAATSAVEIVEVQHHHAHVAAAMAEHGVGLHDEVLGFAFDGTGFGDDGHGAPQIWGGEVLTAGYRDMDRVAHLAPMPLPGGDEGVRNPCRLALAALHAFGVTAPAQNPAIAACDDLERSVVPQQVDRHVGVVPTTSMGRLFDVVSSLLGVRHRIDYEGQAAIELEHAARSGRADRAPLRFEVLEFPGGPLRIDPRPVLAAIVQHQRSRAATADLAAAFHVAVADVVSHLADRCARGRPVVLTGGTFQNELLTRSTVERLDGHEVLTHRLVPPNDGGLSLGQAVVAAASVATDPERSSPCVSAFPAR